MYVGADTSSCTLSIGLASRMCGADGTWGEVDTRNCISRAFQDIQQRVRLMTWHHTHPVFLNCKGVRGVVELNMCMGPKIIIHSTYEVNRRIRLPLAVTTIHYMCIVEFCIKYFESTNISPSLSES